MRLPIRTGSRARFVACIERYRARFASVSALSIALSLLAACSADEALDRARASVVGGAPDATHAAVVALVRKSVDATCSGTLIARDVVLTAGHCTFGIDASDLEVRFGPDATMPTRVVDVRRAVTYPGFTGQQNDLAGGIDLGAVYLATSVADVAPIALRGASLPDPLEGALVTLVGYGANDGATTSGAGTRRSLALPITTACTRVLKLGDANGNACEGDSGGAVLMNEQLVAVVSSGRLGCVAPTNQTRLDVNRAWLDLVLAGAPDAACAACLAADPACDAPVPPPPIDASAGNVEGGGCAFGSSPPSWSSLAIVLAALVAWITRREAAAASTSPSRP